MDPILKLLIFLHFLIFSCGPAIGQAFDNCMEEIFNSKNDSLFKNVRDYNIHSLKYQELKEIKNKYQMEADSMLGIIKKSSLSRKNQIIFNSIIQLARNDTSGDAYSKVKDLDKKLAVKFNSYIPLSAIYEMDREYCRQSLSTKELKLWSSQKCRFINKGKIKLADTVVYIPDSDAAQKWERHKIKLADTVYLHYMHEITIYQFNKDEVIADIGAGSGFFEEVLSKYTDSLIVFASDIDSAKVAQLSTDLKFLEIYDTKNISYIAMLGNEKSTQLPPDHFDKVIIRNAFHHFSSPNEMLVDIKRIMKKDGKLFIVDFLLGDGLDEVAHCGLSLTRSVFLKYLNDNGFILKNETKLQHHNFKCFEFRLIQ